MKDAYILDQTFESIDCIKCPLEKGEYENCTFKNCNLEFMNLSGFSFTGCEFIECNLSMAKLLGAAFRDVVFKECKMLGLQFSDCNGFGLFFRFEGCILNNSSFYQTSIKKTIFKECRLVEVDFTECDLSNALMNGCELSGAVFDNTKLEKADLRSSVNYSIDPAINKLKKAKFSLSEVSGLLYKLDIEIDRNG